MTTAFLLLAMTASLLTLSQRVRGLRGGALAGLAAARPRSVAMAALQPADAGRPRRSGRPVRQAALPEAGGGPAAGQRALLGPLVDGAIAAALRGGRAGLRHWLVEPALRRKVVLADPVALEGALCALLRRAVMHSREDDIIALRWISGGERVAIVVEDEGDGLLDTLPGQAAHDCPHPEGPARCAFWYERCAFGELCDLDSGLRQARRLAAAQGGDVRIEAAPGIGARAWLTLPRERVLEAA